MGDTPRFERVEYIEGYCKGPTGERSYWAQLHVMEAKTQEVSAICITRTRDWRPPGLPSPEQKD